jgi:23S rRNA pseudouridine2605 synthase
MNEPDTTRVNKYLAHATGLSRREVDNAVAAGRITINGQKAAMGAQVSPSDDIRLDNKPVSKTHSYTYVLLHKPVGYICSRRRQGDTPTIYDLLPEKLRLLKAVGRLDKDSSGLLLLTDDGNLAHQMTHPKFYKRKIYEIKLDKPLEPLHHQLINDVGITLEDGPSKLSLEKLSDNGLSWRVIMSEGRNRQIRRTFDSLGYFVKSLHRIQFGQYQLNDLKPGTYLAIDRD